MALPRSEPVANMFARPQDYDPKNSPDWPRWAMPKLNGVRAMWVPGVGLFSKDGVPYESGVLPHIEAALKDTDLWLDGELYAHGMSLQQINSRAGVNRVRPHADHAAIKLHVFDSPQLRADTERRQHIIRTKEWAPAIELVPHTLVKCDREAANAYHAWVADGYEGACYKQPGEYVPGRSSMILRRKGWKDADYDVVALMRGDGKYDNSIGGIICRTPAGLEFHVGSFAFDDDERLKIWAAHTKPTRAKVKYLGLTDKQVPYNTTCLELI